MAVVQITSSRIRTGTKNNLPEALAEAELAFVLDTGEVMIGAPNFPSIQSRRGNPGEYPYSNIKLITEFDVTWTLRDDVYYHGPLKVATIPVSITPTTENFVAVIFDKNNISNCILDYSITPDPNTPGLPRKMGTLYIQTDGTNVGIYDISSALNVATPQDVEVEFNVQINGDNVELLALNTSSYIYKIHYCGRQWLANI